MSHGRLMDYAALCLGWCTAIAPHVGWAAPAFSRNFNGPEKSWQLLSTATPAQILSQECLRGGVHDNSGFERIIVAAPAGESALLVCAIPRVAVLDELQIRLWVNASRPDVQLAAARGVAAFARTCNTARRRPQSSADPIYNRPGQWQELNIAEVPRLLADQVRVMRVMPGASIDPHEAFIDAIVLFIAGNPSGTEVGTDDLQVDGVLLSATADGDAADRKASGGQTATSPALRQRPQPTGPQAAA